jgi:hypothetical protein
MTGLDVLRDDDASPFESVDKDLLVGHLGASIPRRFVALRPLRPFATAIFRVAARWRIEDASRLALSNCNGASPFQGELAQTCVVLRGPWNVHFFAFSPSLAARPWTAFSLRLIWVAMDAALSPDCIISSSWASSVGVQAGFANSDGALISASPSVLLWKRLVASPSSEWLPVSAPSSRLSRSNSWSLPSRQSLDRTQMIGRVSGLTLRFLHLQPKLDQAADGSCAGGQILLLSAPVIDCL